MLQTKNWLKGGLLLAILLQAVWSAAARADEYDDIRAKLAARGGPVNTADPDVAAQIAVSQANAQTYWDSMIRDQGRTALWPDLANWSASATVTGSFTRLSVLAGAYYGGNANLKGNPDVLAAVLSGMDFMTQNYYKVNMTSYDNWWDWQIGAAQQFNAILLTIYNDSTDAQRAAWLAIIDRFVPDPTLRTNPDGTLSATVETGANRLDKAYVVVMRGLLGKNSSKMAQGRDAIGQALQYVTSGDGFYTDGSFIQHTHEPYVGGYGGVLLTDISRLYYLLNDTSWSITDPNKGNAYDWAMNAFRPFMVDGAMMDSQRGRGITRQFSTDHVVGRGIVSNMLGLSDVVTTAQADQLKSVIKGWIERDTTFGSSYFTPVPTAVPGVLSGMSPSDITRLKAILNDSSIPAAPEATETRIYASADRVLQRQPGYAWGLSMFSKRMSAFESGNGENLNGWWTGMGMTYLYNADKTQYSGNYWATVDMWRLAGTTTDRSGSGTPVAWKNYYNNRMGIGGAELNKQFAAVGMDFTSSAVTGTPLSAKKAWFLFGDKVVAVGSGITTTDGKTVETIVENRKLLADGSNALTVNSVAKSTSLPWSETMAGVNWAHLAGGASSGADIGYVFPDAPAVTGLREQRTGAWSNGFSGGDPTPVSDNYLSLALNHGANPSNAAYTYIVLPNRTAAEVAAFASNTGITVLERSTTASAVQDSTQGVTGVVFWNDASKTVNANGSALVTADRKAAVVLKQAGSDLQVSVADPTQVYTGSLNIEINRSAGSVLSTDPGVTVVQTTPTIKLQVAVNGSLGKSYASRFIVTSQTNLSPAGDAFVRDGTYASTNYGTTGTLTVKSDAVGYSRKGMLKFDLSGVTGTIVGASLRLTPVAVGMTGITHNLYQTVDANWDEATVTWNNRPANSTLVNSWSVPAVNSAVQVDVTNVAQTAMGGNKLLSFDVEASQNYGASGSVDYASRQHANVGYRPILVLTVQ